MRAAFITATIASLAIQANANCQRKSVQKNANEDCEYKTDKLCNQHPDDCEWDGHEANIGKQFSKQFELKNAYFKKQEGGTCMMYAINNLLGGDVMSDKDWDRIYASSDGNVRATRLDEWFVDKGLDATYTGEDDIENMRKNDKEWKQWVSGEEKQIMTGNVVGYYIRWTAFSEPLSNHLKTKKYKKPLKEGGGHMVAIRREPGFGNWIYLDSNQKPTDRVEHALSWISRASGNQELYSQDLGPTTKGLFDFMHKLVKRTKAKITNIYRVQSNVYKQQHEKSKKSLIESIEKSCKCKKCQHQKESVKQQQAKPPPPKSDKAMYDEYSDLLQENSYIHGYNDGYNDYKKSEENKHYQNANNSGLNQYILVLSLLMVIIVCLTGLLCVTGMGCAGILGYVFGGKLTKNTDYLYLSKQNIHASYNDENV